MKQNYFLSAPPQPRYFFWGGGLLSLLFLSFLQQWFISQVTQRGGKAERYIKKRSLRLERLGWSVSLSGVFFAKLSVFSITLSHFVPQKKKIFRIFQQVDAFRYSPFHLTGR